MALWTASALVNFANQSLCLISSYTHHRKRRTKFVPIGQVYFLRRKAKPKHFHVSHVRVFYLRHIYCRSFSTFSQSTFRNWQGQLTCPRVLYCMLQNSSFPTFFIYLHSKFFLQLFLASMILLSDIATLLLSALSGNPFGSRTQQVFYRFAI